MSEKGNQAKPKQKQKHQKKYLPPIARLKGLLKHLTPEYKELVDNEGEAPHIIVVDPRNDDKKLSIVYFGKDSHFRVYDNYQGEANTDQEVWYFENSYGVSDFINTDLEDESSCYHSVIRKISA